MIRLNKILIFFLVSLIYSCANIDGYNSSSKIKKKYFNSKGFALIYDDSLFKNKIIRKKINNDEYAIFHSILKKNSKVRIINPTNSKFVEVKVKSKTNYPSLFSSVISKKIANDLDLDINNPYIEIQEIKVNKKFIAKKSNTFEEERQVAENAPVTEIKMDDISNDINEIEKLKKEYVFFIIISDFYYPSTADELKNDLKGKTKLANIFVKKINNKKYRLLVGPFKNFNALKSSYISLNNLGFDDLNIFRE